MYIWYLSVWILEGLKKKRKFFFPNSETSRKFFYDFFSKSKCQICVVFWCDSWQFVPGIKRYIGLQIEYFPKNFWVFEGYFDNWKHTKHPFRKHHFTLCFTKSKSKSKSKNEIGRELGWPPPQLGKIPYFFVFFKPSPTFVLNSRKWILLMKEIINYLQLLVGSNLLNPNIVKP